MLKTIFCLLLLWVATLIWPNFFEKIVYRILNLFCRTKRKEITARNIIWPYLEFRELEQHKGLEADQSNEETVLLVHGIYARKDLWATYIRKLSNISRTPKVKYFRYISVDLPGFGEQSRDPEIAIDIDSQVDHLVEFLNALEIDKVHIIGNSMGGLIASKFAIKHGDRLHSLTNINSAGTLTDVVTETEKLIQENKNPFEIATIERFDQLSRLSAYKPGYFPRFLKQAFINNYINNREYYDKNMKELVDYIYSQPLNPDLHKINVPTLVLWGLHDKVFDVSCCGHLEQSIPNCKVVILHNSAHIPFIEQAQLTAMHQIEFLNSINTQT